MDYGTLYRELGRKQDWCGKETGICILILNGDCRRCPYFVEPGANNSVQPTEKKESDAKYCSNCGAILQSYCKNCFNSGAKKRTA